MNQQARHRVYPAEKDINADEITCRVLLEGRLQAFTSPCEKVARREPLGYLGLESPAF
jgi:hypothetical protein